MSKLKKIVLKFLGPLILSESKIISNERLSPHFQFLTIKGKSLKKAEWIPGQKIQIQLAHDQMRSYTPSSWDSKTGEMQTLVYMHGKGPGALWARDAKVNQSVVVLGPRGSLKLEPEMQTILFFGDETTFGLAHALKKYSSDKKYFFFFESIDTHESEMILNKFELSESLIFSLNQHGQIADSINEIFKNNSGAQIVLSGKQQSIVAIREKLYAREIPREQITKKVYWGWKDDPNGKLKH
jgi:ferric-chelate reductase (NADPH)